MAIRYYLCPLSLWAIGGSIYNETEQDRGEEIVVGSKQYYLYTTDATTQFVIQIDESNSEAMGAANTPVGTLVLYGIPNNLRPRYARYVTASGLRSRNIPICDDTILSSALPATITTAAADEGTVTPGGENTFRLKTLVGEIFSNRTSIPDTGLTDGD